MASMILEGLTVSFPIYDSNSRSLKKRLLGSATGGQIRADTGPTVVRALDNVSLHLRHGDRVGLIGHNGAGKTTLLRAMAGIYEPEEGRVAIDGHVAPLFDIALGMDPESTGRENITLRGLYLGMSPVEIGQKLDEIAEFTELGSFLDLPMRTYSAGMRIRLAFAIVTSIKPDILLLDEGIGAGDAAFLAKAQERLTEFLGSAGIVVLASHSDHLVKSLCTRCVLLNHGKVISQGETEDMLKEYESLKRSSAAEPG